MGRPRIDAAVRRSRQVSIRLTPGDAKRIAAAAERAATTPTGFVHQAALDAAGARPTPAERARHAAMRAASRPPAVATLEVEAPHEIVALRRDLARVGSLLNQLLRLRHRDRHQQGRWPADDDLLRPLIQSALDGVARLIDALLP